MRVVAFLKTITPAVRRKLRESMEQLSWEEIWIGAKETFLKLLMSTYPLIVFGTLFYFLTLDSQAGVIRKVQISTEKPTVVRLAKGRTTALQLWLKADRLALGSPNRVQVDFLGKDVAITPLAKDPGNLLIYTRGARYVVLFQLVSESAYDDVVILSPARSGEGTIRLEQDTYHTVSFRARLEQKSRTDEADFLALIKDDGRRIETDQWPEFIGKSHVRCKDCILRSKGDEVFLICSKPASTIQCDLPRGAKLKLERRGS